MDAELSGARGIFALHGRADAGRNYGGRGTGRNGRGRMAGATLAAHKPPRAVPGVRVVGADYGAVRSGLLLRAARDDAAGAGAGDVLHLPGDRAAERGD